VHRDHLLSVSDNRIEAFSIADRSAPALASSLVTFDMVRHVAQLDGGVMGISNRLACKPGALGAR
jgi:hypothetical protein